MQRQDSGRNLSRQAPRPPTDNALTARCPDSGSARCQLSPWTRPSSSALRSSKGGGKRLLSPLGPNCLQLKTSHMPKRHTPEWPALNPVTLPTSQPVHSKQRQPPSRVQTKTSNHWSFSLGILPAFQNQHGPNSIYSSPASPLRLCT